MKLHSVIYHLINNILNKVSKIHQAFICNVGKYTNLINYKTKLHILNVSSEYLSVL